MMTIYLNGNFVYCFILVSSFITVNSKLNESKCDGYIKATCIPCSFLHDKKYNQDVECQRDCIWNIHSEKCVDNNGIMINCGDHGAYTCEECPRGMDGTNNGRNWCKGDCVWNVQTSTCSKHIQENRFQTKNIQSSRDKHPNIIFVLADDLGFTEVHYNNASMITPNIDKLSEEGIKLNQNYMQSSCTPSRSSLMTGMYPLHIGEQKPAGGSGKRMTPTGLSLDYNILPAKLRLMGYDTHLVGKWDLGYCNEAYTPTRRGFDTFYGLWGARESPYIKESNRVKDWKIGLENAETHPEKHSGYLIMDQVKSLLYEYTSNIQRNPFFLLLSTPLPHEPHEVPKKYYDMYSQVKDEGRRKLNAMVTMLDDSIGNLTQMITHAGIKNNTVLIFSSDNGPGLYHEPNLHDRLGRIKGKKGNDMFEGGTRVPGFVHSPILPKSFKTDVLFHVSDWFPTILRIAGATSEEVRKLNLDGVDHYETFFSPDSNTRGPRKDMVYNIRMEDNIPVGAVRKGWWKYGQYFLNGTLERLLFDLENDPTETRNLIHLNKEKRKMMTQFFMENVKSMVPSDSPLPCGCPDSVPGCTSLEVFDPHLDCTSCLNADSQDFIQSGWCNIESKTCEQPTM